MARSNGPKLASENRAIATNARWLPRNQHRSVAFYWVRFAADQIVVTIHASMGAPIVAKENS